jgi:hypothetical protein
VSASTSPVATNADATRGAHERAILRGRGIAYSVTLGSAAALLAGAYLHSAFVIVGGTLAVMAVALVAAHVIAERRAEADFFAAYAAARGLSLVGTIEPLPLTPLLGAGDRRHFDHYMEGPLSRHDGAPSCGLGHYTFEVREHDGDGDGRHWESRHFTVCVVDAEAGISLFPGIFLARKRGLFGFLDGKQWLSHTNRHKVELESAELCERYDLYVDSAQDELLLRELFAPSFVAWLAEHPLAPCFEYRAGTLVVYLERTLEDEGNLDWLREATAEIAGRIAREVEEQRTRTAA